MPGVVVALCDCGKVNHRNLINGRSGGSIGVTSVTPMTSLLRVTVAVPQWQSLQSSQYQAIYAESNGSVMATMLVIVIQSTEVVVTLSL